MRNGAIIIWSLCALFLLCGCDHLTTYKITSTLFDGVPSLPPPDEFCREYHEKKKAEELEALKKQQRAEVRPTGSVHPPYEEKKCDNCHDKSMESGLRLPKRELCFSCHPKITAGTFSHGPASVGECLACHDPHSSSFDSLLKTKKEDICSSCHKEQRLAESLHNKVMSRGLLCVDCHNPHAGPAKFFLK